MEGIMDGGDEADRNLAEASAAVITSSIGTTSDGVKRLKQRNEILLKRVFGCGNSNFLFIRFVYLYFLYVSWFN